MCSPLGNATINSLINVATFLLLITSHSHSLTPNTSSGTLLGFQVIPQAFYDLGYVNNGLMILPPMALIVIAVIIWVHRAKNKELQEN